MLQRKLKWGVMKNSDDAAYFGGYMNDNCYYNHKG